MSRSNRRVGGLNINEVPVYDNGAGYVSTRQFRSVPARKPEVVSAPRVQSYKVTSSRQTPPAAPYVAPLNVVKRKPVAQAPGAELYRDRPLPPVPGSAAAAGRPQGVVKPSTINLNKPLPPLPRQVPVVRPAMNGVYTSTGQRIGAPVEQSAWSNTTESTRAIRRRQKRDKNLQSHSAAIVNAAHAGRATKAPELLKSHGTIGKPGQDRSRILQSKWTASQAAGRYERRQEEKMALARIAAAKKAIIPGRSGIHRDTIKTRAWQVLTEQEKTVVAHQYEIDVARKQQGSAARGGRKNSSKCSVM